MKIGICGGLSGHNADGRAFDFLPAAREAGFDYVELNLSAVAALDETEFADMLKRVQAGGIPVEACNVMFPGTIRLTGPAADPRITRGYLEKAYARAAQLGIRAMVFGSGGARNVPDGFPLEQAWLQLVEMLRMAGEIAARHDLTIAIEPLNKAESNIIQTASEGFTLTKLVGHPNVKLLVDYYHMHKDGEDCGIIRTAGDLIAHAHFADPQGRCYPEQEKPAFKAFFDPLKAIGYSGRVSLEAGYTDFVPQAAQARRVMRALAG